MAKSPYVHENLSDDDDDVLPDGATVRVPMMMRDSVEVVFVGIPDGASLHRPGQRFSVDAAARARVEQARAEGIREMCAAWKNPPTADVSGEFRGAQEGDVCTVREGGVAEGSPGHLRLVNGELRCVQDARPTYDAAKGQRIKDAAYREMVDELQSAWRTPAPKSIEPRAKATDAPRTMSLADAQAIRDAAYRQYCDELVNAWKAR